jgi:hypothetical protein
LEKFLTPRFFGLKKASPNASHETTAMFHVTPVCRSFSRPENVAAHISTFKEGVHSQLLRKSKVNFNDTGYSQALHYSDCFDTEV